MRDFEKLKLGGNGVGINTGNNDDDDRKEFNSSCFGRRFKNH